MDKQINTNGLHIRLSFQVFVSVFDIYLTEELLVTSGGHKRQLTTMLTKTKRLNPETKKYLENLSSLNYDHK